MNPTKTTMGDIDTAALRALCEAVIDGAGSLGARVTARQNFQIAATPAVVLRLLDIIADETNNHKRIVDLEAALAHESSAALAHERRHQELLHEKLEGSIAAAKRLVQQGELPPLQAYSFSSFLGCVTDSEGTWCKVEDARAAIAASAGQVASEATLRDWLTIIYDNEYALGDRLQRLGCRIQSLLAGDAEDRYPTHSIREQSVEASPPPQQGKHTAVDKMLEASELDELGQEVARLQKALCFWLPSVTEREDEVAERLLQDAFLLCGIDGNIPDDFKTAQELGWVTLAAAPTPPAQPAPDLAARDATPVPVCQCEECLPNTWDKQRMILCATCGNKRCPHAASHRNTCTGSNEPGQVGSCYPAAQGDKQ